MSDIEIELLLIEEDRFVQAVHSAMLLLLNCRIHLARNGRQAIEKAKKRYDIILIDAELSDVNSGEVIRVIRSTEGDKKSVPIILLSDNDTLSTEKYLLNGTNEVLIKPVSFRVMQEMLQRYGFITIKSR
jgi:two-component system, sensor histidine kinase